ncbi:MAG: DUF1294 domain-containing protein [Bacteroidales bacterium]|nr:DUF1294 domain-containing protein [Bacteroidales bacterium]MBQ7984416.1 DUF1294 domain-containing protein [Bacteroidales bacterium]
MRYVFVYLIAINIFAFCLYAVDKRRAVKGKRRIKELHLMFSALIGGSIGALSAMQLCRHKTKHLKFTIGVPLILLCQIIAVLYLLYHAQ